MTTRISEIERIKKEFGSLDQINIQKYLKSMYSITLKPKLEPVGQMFFKPKQVWPFDMAKQICEPFVSMVSIDLSVGDGGFSNVSLCTIKGLKLEFVMKVIKRIDSDVDINDVASEIRALEATSGCKLIVDLIYAGFNKLNAYCMILEYASGGTLFDHAYSGAKISLQAWKFIGHQLAQALQYLHSKYLSHGDLKPNNVCLTHKGNVRLFDFGKSRSIETPVVISSGTMHYNSPEIILKVETQSSPDWWAYACTMAEVMQKEMVFDDPDDNRKKIYKKIVKKPPVVTISDPMAQDLFQQMLLKDIKLRLCKKVLEHEFFNDVSNKPIFVPGKYVQPAVESEAVTCSRNDINVEGICNRQLLIFPNKSCLERFM
uniref:Protein kinase domain-containing protein n=1 Tax=Panagrolaimus superbus TaxID=310955 RepID=A0A914Y3F4_9BILA